MRRANPAKSSQFFNLKSNANVVYQTSIQPLSNGSAVHWSSNTKRDNRLMNEINLDSNSAATLLKFIIKISVPSPIRSCCMWCRCAERLICVSHELKYGRVRNLNKAAVQFSKSYEMFMWWVPLTGMTFVLDICSAALLACGSYGWSLHIMPCHHLCLIFSSTLY